MISEGWHRRAGEEHAECLALKKAGKLARGSTLYVNLEPCNHFGLTPPCTEAIINAGVNRVVACIVDPNPLVQGKGIKRLRDAGLGVDVGHLQAQAEKLNEVYIHFIKNRTPFVHVKAGLSMDGRIATASGQSQWITSDRARRFAHRLRRRYDAILVGIGTVLADDPRLNVRLEGDGEIQRIILDSRLRTSPDARIFSVAEGQDIIIATTDTAKRERLDILRSRGAEVIVCTSKNDRVDLNELMRLLGERRITSVLVEGGGAVIAGFINAGLVNKVTFVYAPKIIGGKGAVPVVGGKDIENLDDAYELKNLRCFRLGPDIAVEGYPVARNIG